VRARHVPARCRAPRPSLYERLAEIVAGAELPRVRVDVPTRMVASSPEAVYRGLAIAPHTKVVTVGIARAGTMPSQVVTSS